MKKTFLLTLFCASFAFVGISNAQSQFKGSYNVYNGYTNGSAAGQAGYGTATVSSNGKASFSLYYPGYGVTSKGTGRVNAKGVFSFSDGTNGNGQFYANKVAVGRFSNSTGSGFFAIIKK